jgi:hypothetical protein
MTTHRSRATPHPSQLAPTDSRTTRRFSALWQAIMHISHQDAVLALHPYHRAGLLSSDEASRTQSASTRPCQPTSLSYMGPEHPDALSCGSAGVFFSVPSRVRRRRVVAPLFQCMCDPSRAIGGSRLVEERGYLPVRGDAGLEG